MNNGIGRRSDQKAGSRSCSKVRSSQATLFLLLFLSVCLLVWVCSGIFFSLLLPITLNKILKVTINVLFTLLYVLQGLFKMPSIRAFGLHTEPQTYMAGMLLLLP